MRAAYVVVCAAAFTCALCMAEEEKVAPTKETAKEPVAEAKADGTAGKVSYSIGFMNGKNMKKQEMKLDLDAFKKGMKEGASASPEQLSHAIGLVTANGMKEQEIDLDADQFSAGMAAGYTGGKSTLTEEEMQETLQSFQTEMRAKMMEKMKKEQAVEGKKSSKYLEDNLKKEGVKATKSGLQYKVIKEGKGALPKATDTVKVHYKGTLTDGTEFDSSYKRKEPAEFMVGGVIKGWTEALQMMPVGSKWELTIPSDLAYGEKGMGGDIPPNSVLCFEVELLEVKAGETEKSAEPMEK